ncbi:hypothetical protein EA462_15200 [Natrarchaeobius halalkaliphilus]|uniref:Uncharacterized protein n=1 Tax=Natrarchaeobius halalkaliphilus TaxID=1679091 RepID=A0A3N6LY26_9EURY|nr:hypothetical protein [Natrarchaeobius halalkaliphilus]RQG86991.1 hypothetical protein EA462_15200 [Natrarchaeobius halalkaliphilus]
MALIVDRTAERDCSTESKPTLEDESQRERIDVTDLRAAGIEEFVRSSVETDAVSLENRGARTYLVLEE